MLNRYPRKDSAPTRIARREIRVWITSPVRIILRPRASVRTPAMTSTTPPPRPNSASVTYAPRSDQGRDPRRSAVKLSAAATTMPPASARMTFPVTLMASPPAAVVVGHPTSSFTSTPSALASFRKVPSRGLCVPLGTVVAHEPGRKRRGGGDHRAPGLLRDSRLLVQV